MKTISVNGYSKLRACFTFEKGEYYEVVLNNKTMFKTHNEDKARKYFELLHSLECLSYEDDRELNINDIVIHNKSK